MPGDVIAIRLETTSDGGTVLQETKTQLSQLDGRSRELAQSTGQLGRASREAGVTATDAAGRWDKLKATIGQYGKQILIATGITLGMAATVRFVSSSIAAFGRQEAAMAKLRGVSRGLGLDYEMVGTKVAGAAAAMQRKTLFADEAQIEGLSQLMLFTRSYDKTMEHHNLLLDVATGLSMDLSTASRYLALAIQGDYNMLKRYVPALRELSDEQLAAGEGMELLEKTFGGLAEEVSHTRTGQIKQAANAWDDFKESAGELFLILTGPTAKDAARDIESLHNAMEEFALTGSWNKIQAPEGNLFLWAEEQRERERERLSRAVLRQERSAHEWKLVEGLSKRTSFFFEGELVGKGKSLWQDIREEMEKSSPALDKIDQKAREYMGTVEQIKKTWREINDLTMERGRVSGRMAGTVFGAFEKLTPEVQAELLGGFGGSELAPGLTLQGAVKRTEGISGFQRFQEADIMRSLGQQWLSTAARSSLAGELLETKLGMLESASTPGMRASSMQSVFETAGFARREEVARINEEIQDRKRLVTLTGEQAQLARQTRDYVFALLNETRDARRTSKDRVAPEDIF